MGGFSKLLVTKFEIFNLKFNPINSVKFENSLKVHVEKKSAWRSHNGKNQGDLIGTPTVVLSISTYLFDIGQNGSSTWILTF